MSLTGIDPSHVDLQHLAIEQEMNRRASCVGTFEVFEAAHVALRTLLAFSQPVNCIFLANRNAELAGGSQ